MDEHSLIRERPSPTRKAGLESALQPWESVLESLPLGVCICDLSGALVRYNSRAAELWGRAPRRGCDVAQAFDLAGHPLDGAESPIAEVLRNGGAVKNRESVLEHADGARTFILSNAEPLLDGAGELVGVVNCFQDISDRKLAERRLTQQERRHRELLDALPAAIYTTDAQGRITYYNQAAVEFSGRRPTIGADEWCVTWKLYSPDGSELPHDRCPMAVALKENRPVRGVEAVAERPDGSRRPFVPFPTPLRDVEGRLVGGVNMLVDITELREAETCQKALLDELNHRVKNTLASVQSLAAHSLRGERDPRGMRDAFEARLLALSNVHNLIAEGRWVETDLEAVLRDVLAPYGGQAEVRPATPLIHAPARLAVVLGMVLHELATNAAKYGALSAPAGRVIASWSVEAGESGRLLVLDWLETGGPAVRPPLRRGFGAQFITRAVEHELDGRIELAFESDGLRCRIKAPL